MDFGKINDWNVVLFKQVSAKIKIHSQSDTLR